MLTAASDFKRMCLDVTWKHMCVIIARSLAFRSQFSRAVLVQARLSQGAALLARRKHRKRFIEAKCLCAAKFRNRLELSDV